MQMRRGISSPNLPSAFPTRRAPTSFCRFPFMCGSASIRRICNRRMNWCFMKTSRVVCAALLLGGSVLSPTGPTFAQSPGHSWDGGQHEQSHEGGGPGSPHFTFQHRDFGQFTPAEHSNWVAGRWQHGWHDGRLGWWWLAGGGWFFYDQPVYPYPGYVSDYYDYDDGYGSGYPGQYWYYCSNPPGYYPYVQYCSVPWQPVPAWTPPAYGPGPQPDGGPPPGSDQQGPYGGPGQAYPLPPGSAQPPPPGAQQGPGGPPPQGAPDNQSPPPGYPGSGPGEQPPPPPPGNYNGPN